VIYGDDQVKPDVGKQVADEMVKKHQVNFVSGIIWSNVMLAVAPSVTGAGTFMIGTNAGPHDLAGKGCNELFFTTSWQNDQTPEAMGKYMQDAGINDVYLMAPNYAAGKDMLTGFKRYFKGRLPTRSTRRWPAGLTRRSCRSCARKIRRRCSSSIRAGWDPVPEAVLGSRAARPVPALLRLYGR
jgi:branched-chain amino acid transport system substrate-binding protein